MRKLFVTVCLLVVATMAMAQQVFDVMQYGAVGDGKTDDAAAIQQAIDQCEAGGGGRVLMRGGHTFMAGTVRLKSNSLPIPMNKSITSAPSEPMKARA